MIITENLTFSYTGLKPFILDGICMEIKDGEYVSVVGENGCGKSTLMRLILNFLKPTRGIVITQAKRVGYVPQKSENASSGFPITVFEMLNSYRKLLKIYDRGVIGENLRLVGLSGFSGALMGTLSGGQKPKSLDRPRPNGQPRPSYTGRAILGRG
jgi:ABC-type Mn/Zn transport systems, ATPase component